MIDEFILKGDAHIHALLSSKCIFAKDRNVLKPTPGLWLKKSITKRSCFRHQRFNGDVESIGFMDFSEKTLVG